MSTRLFRTFKSGDLVTKSGQYAALHSTPHVLMERALYLEGSQFQGCRMCPWGVWYRLEAPCVPIASTVLAMKRLAAC
jgi:hypothetical protein